MTQALAEPRAEKSAEWFGHPRGLTILFSAEMWERFSYYGMRALLILYMLDHLLIDPARSGEVIGLDALRRALEALSGPLGVQPFASQIYGLYTGFVYLTPILGGMIADRWLGRRRTVVLGGALMAAGHFLMAFESCFLIALALLVLGNGAFKPNIVTQVGGLYDARDARRDRAYSIFYVGINIGAFFSPLIAGTLGERLGWHYGFVSAGIGMALGLAIYLFGLPLLPPDAPRASAPAAPRENLARETTGLLLLFLPSALFWAAYEQQGNTIALFAERFADRSVDLLVWRGEIPVTWFQAVNPLMIFLFTPALVAFWGQLAREGREPSTIAKLALGCLGVAGSYLVLAGAAAMNADGKTSSLWLVAYFVLLTLGELHFWPITLSLVSRLAPERSTLMGLWLASNFVGGVAAGRLGGFWSSLSPGAFFALVAAVALAGGVMILAFRRKLHELIGQRA
jgi:POT family proton-dependent oligopeptide transporter